jgi:hypothetical protein
MSWYMPAEFGGFGAPLGKLEIVRAMKHNGEVNRYATCILQYVRKLLIMVMTCPNE